MERVSQQNNIEQSEKIKSIYIVNEPFSIENKLLDKSGKLDRGEIKRIY